MGRLHDLLKRRIPEPTLILIYAALIGVGAGYGAVGFRALISFFNHLAFGVSQEQLATYHGFRLFFVPILGGLLVGLLVHFFAREAKGHGVPEVMYAVTELHGVLRPRVVVVKALASSICIGTGGSVGREGPIVQIGSAWGSTFGQLIGVRENQLKILVACGAAGGIAATFNAPIGGVLFGAEIILGSFMISNLGAMVVASVIAAAIGRLFFGDHASFVMPPYTVSGIPVLSAFVVLGILGGLFGVLYTRVLYLFEDFWGSLRRIPEWVKPATGGIVIAAVGFFLPQVMGVGYPSVDAALAGKLSLWMLIALLVGKLFLTSATLGSGGSGGVFAPGLYMGSMLGGAFGVLAHIVVPSLPVTGGAFAMVGMATVFASSARAPITAIVMLFEMTGNYNLILPLMLSTVIGTTLASVLEKESIYTFKLFRRGVDIIRKRRPDRLTSILVEEAMRPLSVRLTDSMTVDQALETLYHEDRNFAVMAKKSGQSRGVISRQLLLEEMSRRKGNRKLARVSPAKTGSVFGKSPLADASRIMSELNVPYLVVLDDEGDPVGIINTDDIVRAYSRSIS